MSFGGSSGAKRAESKPTAIRMETGIFSDPQNPAGLRLGETAEEYANLLQQQTVPPHPTGQFQLPAQVGLAGTPIGAIAAPVGGAAVGAAIGGGIGQTLGGIFAPPEY